MTALFALIRKDLILFLGDRRALFVTLAMPILLGAFFGYLFGGVSGKRETHLNVGLVQQDNSEASQKLVAALKSEPSLTVTELGRDEARDKVTKGKLHAALVIPPGFGEAAGSAFFSQGSKPEITVYYDPSQGAALQMVKGLITQHAMQAVSGEMFGGKGGERLVERSLADLEKTPNQTAEVRDLRGLLGSLQTFQKNRAAPERANEAGKGNVGLSLPFITRDEAMSSGPDQYNGYAHSFAGMAVQFILFMGIDAGIAVLLAKRQGIWNRLLASPLSENTLLLARALSGALIAFVLICIIFAVAALFFGVRITGSVIGFVGVCASFALLASSFGLLVAAFGRTPEAARSLAIFVTLILVMLGGAWVPAFVFPEWLQTATLVVPTRWAVDGLDAMTWRGQGLSVALPAMAVQLGFTALFGMLALWKFRQQRA